ncbi:putative isocitrate dehydrogenase [NAD] subunit beta, mitochondrial [Trichinella britovi]|uniref:Isocitrate dehydrogenase [NAD] subunit, mitochondrial n=1 Tax=Trichinella britovi TaxID=45882 RepID=A0A0V1CEE0_TRIBR|nr:putative isocitrate dehydrogenase [NAD] subunit beta, mitochondrial [Trichinella britovi]
MKQCDECLFDSVFESSIMNIIQLLQLFAPGCFTQLFFEPIQFGPTGRNEISGLCVIFWKIVELIQLLFDEMQFAFQIVHPSIAYSGNSRLRPLLDQYPTVSFLFSCSSVHFSTSDWPIPFFQYSPQIPYTIVEIWPILPHFHTIDKLYDKIQPKMLPRSTFSRPVPRPVKPTIPLHKVPSPAIERQLDRSNYANVASIHSIVVSLVGELEFSSRVPQRCSCSKCAPRPIPSRSIRSLQNSTISHRRWALVTFAMFSFQTVQHGVVNFSRIVRNARTGSKLPFYKSHSIQVRGTHSDGMKSVTAIPGEGVGFELVNSVKEVVRLVGIPVKFDDIFFSEIHEHPSVTVEEVVNLVKKNRVALKGTNRMTYVNRNGELHSFSMQLRKELDLFANVVDIQTMDGIKSRHKQIDFIIIREQTEGEYSALEHESVTGVVECLKIATRSRCRRIAKFAFDYAVEHGRRTVTAVHKANIMKLADGLFLRCCEEVSRDYPQIKFNNLIIDNCCMQLVTRPEQFDVMVMPNLYGNIIDNLAAGLVGGAGVVAGKSVGKHCVVFEPGARHSFHEATGRGIANPTAILLCAANMLHHLGLNKEGTALRAAVEAVLRSGKVRTRDLGGYATTSEFTYFVADHYKI